MPPQGSSARRLRIQIHHLNPALLRAGGFGVITVCRPLEKERLLKELSPSFRNIANVVEDAAILSAELEKTSSAMVRQKAAA